MAIKKDWKDDKVDVSKLNLDLQNPRIPKYVKEHNDINQIRDYLLEKEDVLKIARSIANSGYHKSAIAIVCREKGKLVVLDGNRRLAACQLLLNPKLVSNSRDRKELETLNKKLDKNQLKNVTITITPSRKEAKKEIWDIHVNQHLKPWKVLQKLRMYQNLINSGEYNIKLASSSYGITQTKFKEELAKLFFYEQILERLTKEKEEKELLKSGFNKINRLIISKNGKKLLGYSVNGNGGISINNQRTFDEKLKKLIPYIVTPQRVKAQATQKDLIKEVYSVIDPVNFSIKSTSIRKTISPTKVPDKSKKLVVGTLAKQDWITDSEYRKYVGADRVKKILQEMKKLNPKENENILLVSLRVLLELSLYHKLENKGYIKKMTKDYKKSIKDKNARQIKKGQSIRLPQRNWSPSFREMLNYITIESNGVISSPQFRDALGKVIKGEKNFVEDLNTFVHNVYYIPPKGEPEKIWSKFGRQLFEIISKIK